MSWSKLSDDFSDDCWALSDAAFRLHVEGLIWSNRKLLDLHLPKADVRRFAKDPDAVAELLEVGWWSEDGDEYVIRHHAQYQRSREAVLKQQEANERNGRKGGRPRGKPREQAPRLDRGETQSVSDSLSDSRTERDRTGQDRSVEAEPLPKQDFDDDAWLAGRPVAVGPLRCLVCHERLDPVLVQEGSRTHPGCDTGRAAA